MALQRLKQEAEKAKKELSAAPAGAALTCRSSRPTPRAPSTSTTTLTRAEFEHITRDLLERCKEPVTKALRDAGIQISDINEVILVGGSTRMPAVQELVKKHDGQASPTRA